MPVMSSAMTPLGSKMPTFNLPDVISGRILDSASLDPGKPVLVVFVAAHCPYTRQIAPGIQKLVRGYRDRLNMVAICANDIAQVPEDSPAGLRRLAKELEWTEPFLYNEGQDVARVFGAECTPECFLYDASRTLVYRGEIDDSRPASGLRAFVAKAPSAAPVRAALDALLSGRPIDPNQRPGMGCNIKWRAVAGVPPARM